LNLNSEKPALVRVFACFYFFTFFVHWLFQFFLDFLNHPQFRKMINILLETYNQFEIKSINI